MRALGDLNSSVHDPGPMVQYAAWQYSGAAGDNYVVFETPRSFILKNNYLMMMQVRCDALARLTLGFLHGP